MAAAVAVLYAMANSVYRRLGVDVYDAARDARTFEGGCPVVAHPPCRTWSRLHAFAKAPPGEELLAFHAVAMVRACGGVLEHPAGSALWPHLGLPMPGEQADHAGGWSTCVDQSWFGHRARKRTMLYLVGIEPGRVRLPFRLEPYERSVAAMPKPERSSTPAAFGRWLVDLASDARPA